MGTFLYETSGGATKKGHRYIVPYRGSLKPIRNTQAMPLSPKAKEHRPFVRFRFEILSGFSRNAKSSVLVQWSLSIVGFRALRSKGNFGPCQSKLPFLCAGFCAAL